jgi:glycosyltransferase involved in cell wall biosynthesis
MLGWEFPPFISGGLGTACYGLTRALDRQGHDVLFVLPKSVDQEHASHVTLLSPDAVASRPAIFESLGSTARQGQQGKDLPSHLRGRQPSASGFERTTFLGVPSNLRSTYPGMERYSASEAEADERLQRIAAQVQALRDAGLDVPEELLEALAELDHESLTAMRRSSDYGGDVIADSQRYARLVVRLCRQEQFDVVHAHDWMTYPAGMAIARLTGKPLVTHIHSTEFDRSGEHVNQRVYDIERRGMHAAMKIVAVSMLTKKICVNRYGLDGEKIEVVYNGIESNGHPEMVKRIEQRDKIVLFLGRITMQKGPEYFIAAAKRVLEKMDDVKFIIAGSGDLARRTIGLAADMGIGHKVLFTGFLRGKDVTRVFDMADCFVMPSVSEPFGLVPLEALSRDVPVIISKQSGVSEVLTHALKIDFWDVDEMANKIVAVLRYPPLSSTLREHGQLELRKLTWDGAAQRCARVYDRAAQAMNSLQAVPG